MSGGEELHAAASNICLAVHSKWIWFDSGDIIRTLIILAGEYGRQYAVTVKHLADNARTVSFILNLGKKKSVTQSFKADSYHAQFPEDDAPAICYELAENDQLWNKGSHLKILLERKADAISFAVAVFANGEAQITTNPKRMSRGSHQVEAVSSYTFEDSGSPVIAGVTGETEIYFAGVVTSGTKDTGSGNVVSMALYPIALKPHILMSRIPSAQASVPNYTTRGLGATAAIPPTTGFVGFVPEDPGPSASQLAAQNFPHSQRESSLRLCERHL